MKDRTGTRFNCVHPTDADIIDPHSAPYATRHNPFAYYPSVIDDDEFCQDHGALFITFDENGFSDPDCCNTSGAWGGHVGMLILSPLLKSHTQGQQLESGVASDHYGLLRTVEDAFGIEEHLNMAGSPNAQPINDIWN